MHIKVHTQPDAKRESVKKESNGIYRISVKEPAERNLANERIRNILASELGIAKGKVRIITGHRSLSKLFDVLLDKT